MATKKHPLSRANRASVLRLATCFPRLAPRKMVEISFSPVTIDQEASHYRQLLERSGFTVFGGRHPDHSRVLVALKNGLPTRRIVIFNSPSKKAVEVRHARLD